MILTEWNKSTMRKLRWFIADGAGSPVDLDDLDIVSCYDDELFSIDGTYSNCELAVDAVQDLVNRLMDLNAIIKTTA
jgi:hypothetical protein